MKNLRINDCVMVNGRTTKNILPDKQLEFLYNEKKLPPTEISEMYDVCYGTVLNRLKKIGIFESRKNDKDKQKYNKNHTKQSYEKMIKTIKQQYKNGRIVWNKGLSEKDNDSVKRQVDSLRRNQYRNLPGDKSSNWKGGIDRGTGHRKVIRDKCSLCESKKSVEMHHIDKNEKNNSLDNLMVLCSSCHKKIHFGWEAGKKIHKDTIVNIKSMGSQQTYDIEMESPYHNYIADGFVTHNSSRYCNYGGKDIEFIKPVWIGEHWSVNEYGAWMRAMFSTENQYKQLLECGWRPEQAREVLPNSLKTEIVVQANIREWRHILQLRTARAAHPQIRALMLGLLRELQGRVPVVFDDIGGGEGE